MMDKRTMTLTRPIRRGDDTELCVLTLREPRPGDLHGLNVTDLLQMNATALLTLLPRISVDGLTPHEAMQLAFGDVVQVGSAIIGFAMTIIEKGEAE